MEITLLDGLVITLISMFFVTTVLVILMLLTNLIHKLVPKESTQKQVQEKETSSANPQKSGNKEYEKVAVLTALALAGEANPEALYVVSSVKKSTRRKNL